MMNLRTLLLVCLLPLLGGCSSLSYVNSLMPWHRNNQVDEISVYVTPDTDVAYAISIDVVFIYSDVVQTMLSGLDAVQWFQQKAAIKGGYGPQLEILEWQMVKGYGANNSSQPLPENHKDAINVMAFAYSPDNPKAKAVLTELATPWVVFDKGQLKVVTSAPVSTNGGQPK